METRPSLFCVFPEVCFQSAKKVPELKKQPEVSKATFFFQSLLFLITSCGQGDGELPCLPPPLLFSGEVATKLLFLGQSKP